MFILLSAEIQWSSALGFCSPVQCEALTHLTMCWTCFNDIVLYLVLQSPLVQAIFSRKTEEVAFLLNHNEDVNSLVILSLINSAIMLLFVCFYKVWCQICMYYILRWNVFLRTKNKAHHFMLLLIWATSTLWTYLSVQVETLFILLWNMSYCVVLPMSTIYIFLKLCFSSNETQWITYRRTKTRHKHSQKPNSEV